MRGGGFRTNSTVYIKVVRAHFLWVLNFGQFGGPNAKIQKHALCSDGLAGWTDGEVHGISQESFFLCI